MLQERLKKQLEEKGHKQKDKLSLTFISHEVFLSSLLILWKLIHLVRCTIAGEAEKGT